MAPANDSSPPSSHTPSSAHGCGAMPATIWGTKKMPPPMTFETTIAAASSAPSRGSTRVGGDGLDVLRGHSYVVGGDQAAGADEGQEGLQVRGVAFLVRVQEHQ